MSTAPANALTFNGNVTFYPTSATNLHLDSQTHGMSNHVYVYKSPEGAFQLIAPEYVSSKTLCYGDMAGIKIISGDNVGQTINAKNVEDYLAWQGATPFPSDEIIDLLAAVRDAANKCQQEGASAWFKCIFSQIGELFSLMAAATSVKQYLYQFPIVVRPGNWRGTDCGGAVCAGNSVQFLMLKTSISSKDMSEAIGAYWLCLALLSMLRSALHPALAARFQATRDDRGLPLPHPEDMSALAMLYSLSPDLYNTLTENPAVYSFQTSDSDDKKGWLRQKSLGDSDMTQSFMVAT